MVNGISTQWRKEYYQEAIHQLKSIRGNIEKMPNEIELPITAKNCMFEFGGSKHSTGVAMLVSTASGFPNSAIVLHSRKPNGVHICSRVWPGTLICVAMHQYGIINIGVYKIKTIDKQNKSISGGLSRVPLELVAGITKSEYDQVVNNNWFAHHEKKYPGIRKLVYTTCNKLMDYRCITPMYTEPFKIIKRYNKKDPDFAKLMMHTDLIIPEYVSPVTPQYAVINSNIKDIVECNSFSVFESNILKECKLLYSQGVPYIYTSLYHYPQDCDFITQAFISYQDKSNTILKFIRKSFKYKHIGFNSKRSYDFESYIKSNYNPSYMAVLMNVESGGFGRLVDLCEQSKDRCVSVHLKYVWCTKKYIQS